MSTLKSDGIQPTLNTNNLIIRSGADVERLRIQPNGQILVASTTGTTFAGEVNFSNTTRFPGGVQVGGGIGATRYTALDVVHTNAGLGLPDSVNYNTTRSRSNMMVRPSGNDITLFAGSAGTTGSWLQVQAETGNAVKSLLLNPAGGDVSMGGQGFSSTGTTYGSSNSTLATKSYVDDAGAQARVGTTRHFLLLVSSHTINSISGFNNSPCVFNFGIDTPNNTLTVTIPDGYGIWTIRAEVFGSGALNAAAVSASVYAGTLTGIATVSASSLTILITATRHT